MRSLAGLWAAVQIRRRPPQTRIRTFTLARARRPAPRARPRPQPSRRHAVNSAIDLPSSKAIRLRYVHVARSQEIRMVLPFSAPLMAGVRGDQSSLHSPSLGFECASDCTRLG